MGELPVPGDNRLGDLGRPGGDFRPGDGGRRDEDDEPAIIAGEKAGVTNGESGAVGNRVEPRSGAILLRRANTAGDGHYHLNQHSL